MLDCVLWRFGEEPVAFKEQRGVLLEVLERLGWPLAQEELSMLEKQIHMGHGFLQQASELQDIARQAAQEARVMVSICDQPER